jgi:hypothetical protein
MTTTPEPVAAAAKARSPSPEIKSRSRAYSNASRYSDDDEGEGLAYARSSQDTDRVQFPSATADSSQRNRTAVGASTSRSPSSASAYSTQSKSKPQGLRLDPLSEDDQDSASVVSGPGRKTASAGDQQERRAAAATNLRAPARAMTSPTSPRTQRDQDRDRATVQRRNVAATKYCVRCEQSIPDGRWIQTDGPGVLCEQCWKAMYLPKCRRCNLTIEGAAISSADGQLKGKYHRECFSCFTCSKPFPDKSFYVFDGQPYCAYHYHEVSLIAMQTCAEAVSHSFYRRTIHCAHSPHVETRSRVHALYPTPATDTIPIILPASMSTRDRDPALATATGCEHGGARRSSGTTGRSTAGCSVNGMLAI